MDERLWAALLIFSIFQSVYATEVECPDVWGVTNYDGRCLRVMGLMRTYAGAVSSCQTLSFLLPGDWRLPSIDDLVNTGLDRTWVVSPPGVCIGAVSTKEGKTTEFDCGLLNGVVCIQISGDVKSNEEAQQDILVNIDFIPRDDDIQQAELISSFYANSQQFDDLVYSSMMKKRKKRQAPSNNGKRILTGAQRSKMQSVRTKIGTQAFQSRTLTKKLGSTRRVTSTRKNIASVPGFQRAPADQVPLPAQVPPAGESPAQKSQTMHDRGNKQTLGGNRGLFRGGKNQEAPEKSKTSKKRGRQGREMCMGAEWSRIEDSCVFVSEDTLTWEEAKATCEGFSYKESHATLVNLKEEGMMTRLLAWLDRIAARTGRPTGSFWTSENSLQESGTDVDPLAADGSCVAYMGTDGLGFDLCSQRYQYVCQMKAPIITEDDLVR